MKLVLTIFKIVCVPLALYLAAALGGSILSSNQKWEQADDGITLFVESNGVHTGILMPVVSDSVDWRDLIKAEHLASPYHGTASHILVGWGHAGIYRNAQTWSGVRSGDVWSAIIGSNQTLMHVYYQNYPQANDYRRELRVDAATYQKIATQIRAQFQLNQIGNATPSPGYGSDDLFYEAHGRYDAFNTCNTWTGDILRNAGIRVGIWTPFQGGVMRWFPETGD